MFEMAGASVSATQEFSYDISSTQSVAPLLEQKARASDTASCLLSLPLAIPVAPVDGDVNMAPHVSNHLPVGVGGLGPSAARGIGAQPSMP